MTTPSRSSSNSSDNTDEIKGINANNEVNIAASNDSEVEEKRGSLNRTSSDSPDQGKIPPLEAAMDSNADNNAPSQYGGKTPPLTENGNVNAFKFFNQPAFFSDDLMHKASANRMINARFKEQTVRDVFEGFKSVDDIVEFFSSMAFSPAVIKEYFRSIQSTEDILNQKKIVSYYGYEEIVLVDKSFVKLPSADIVLHDGWEEGPVEPSRTLPVFMILGSSGSGKTFFALKVVAAEIRSRKEGDAVVVYVKLGGNPSSADDRFDPSLLKERLKELFKKECGQKSIVYPLNMHLIVIFDEAGAQELNGFFESHRNLEGIRKGLEKLTKFQPTLVICGTGLTGESLSSDRDIYKFHMRAWTLEDAGAVLQFIQVPPEEIDNIKSAIPTQPLLQALLANGRSANFLLQEIKQLHSRLRSQDSIRWVDRLSGTTPSIVQSVVAQYIGSNGLATLSPAERFQVAASVLNAIEKGRGEEGFPKFLDLPEGLQSRAFSLVDLNVTVRGGQKHYIQTDVHCSVLVSPAIVIVLYTLMGVQADVLTSWRSQELITAMFEFRRRVLSAYDPDNSALITIEDRLDRSVKEGSAADLKASLVPGGNDTQRTLELVQLVRPVPTANSAVNFHLPVFRNDTIWINGEMAPFADVVAGNIFYQCKHTTGSTDTKKCSFNIPEELFKCGLLRRQHKDSPGRIILRGLYALWSRDIEYSYEEKTAGSKSLHPPRSLVSRHKSEAYPLNLIEGPPRQESTKYTHIRNVEGKWEILDGAKYVELPGLPKDLELTFIFSTNAEVLKLNWDIDEVLSNDRAIRKKKEEAKASKKRAKPNDPANTETAGNSKKDAEMTETSECHTVDASDALSSEFKKHALTKTLNVGECRTVDASEALPSSWIEEHALNGLVIKFLIT